MKSKTVLTQRFYGNSGGFWDMAFEMLVGLGNTWQTLTPPAMLFVCPEELFCIHHNSNTMIHPCQCISNHRERV